ncbi:MAG: GNAT family N-acetyltransferase [Pseudomonadota bacterium]
MRQVAPAVAAGVVAELLLRQAALAEADALTSLALRSKAVWGYDEAFMAACRDELLVSADDIQSAGTRLTVADRAGQLAGYCWVEPVSPTVWELEALFVEPDLMGQGIGEKLFRQAVREAASNGASTLTIQSDPQAARFYEKSGCVKVGEKPSGSIPGRVLPLYHLSLSST